MKVAGKFLIDTNILVEFLRGDSDVAEKIFQSELFIPSIVVGELYFGAYASGHEVNRTARLDELSQLLQHFPVMEITENTARHYGKIKSN